MRTIQPLPSESYRHTPESFFWVAREFMKTMSRTIQPKRPAAIGQAMERSGRHVPERHVPLEVTRRRAPSAAHRGMPRARRLAWARVSPASASSVHHVLHDVLHLCARSAQRSRRERAVSHGARPPARFRGAEGLGRAPLPATAISQCGREDAALGGATTLWGARIWRIRSLSRCALSVRRLVSRARRGYGCNLIPGPSGTEERAP